MFRQVAIAIGAHPDDIEFSMAGTLLLLRQAAWEIHCFNIADGCCGSRQYKAGELRRIRMAEARGAAAILGAHFHPPFGRDMEIVYDIKLMRRVAAVIREVRPSIVLTLPPVDYMEDHTNTCRLVVSAAFTHAMPNFKSIPPRPTADHDVAIYHCVPHSMLDPLRRPVIPELFVNTTSVHAVKRAALAEHRSQQAWLDARQGMDSFLTVADEMAQRISRHSRKFKYAEGWCRHLHYGFSANEVDLLGEVLGKQVLVNPAYRCRRQPRF